MKIELTNNEYNVLWAIVLDSQDNGYDFALREQVEKSSRVLKLKLDNLGGVLASLVKKNIIKIDTKSKKDSGYTQIYTAQGDDLSYWGEALENPEFK